MHNSIRANCVDEDGRRFPRSWSYYECTACGVRTKVYLDGEVVTPTDEEWETHRLTPEE